MMHVSVTFLWNMTDGETGAPVYKSRPPEFDFRWGGPETYDPPLLRKVLHLPRLLFYRMAFILLSDIHTQVKSNWGKPENLVFKTLSKRVSLSTRLKYYSLLALYTLLSFWSFFSMIRVGLIFKASWYQKVISFSVGTMFYFYVLIYAATSLCYLALLNF